MLINPKGKEKIVAEIFRILEEIGLRVDNAEVKKALARIGCSEKPNDRISIPRLLIREIAEIKKKKQAEDAELQELYYHCNVDWTHVLLWRNEVEEVREALKKRPLVSAFDCGPTKYYDYRAHKAVAVDTAVFIEMKKLAQATPEVGYVANWYRTDVPPMLERLDSLILAFQHTDKSHTRT